MKAIKAVSQQEAQTKVVGAGARTLTPVTDVAFPKEPQTLDPTAPVWGFDPIERDGASF